MKHLFNLKRNFILPTYYQFLLKGILICFITFLSFTSYAQTAGTAVFMEVKNITQPANNQIQYDVWLTNTGTTSLALVLYSWGINHTPGLANGGTLTHIYISRDLALSATVAYPIAGYTAVSNHLRVTTAPATIPPEFPLVMGIPYRLATMRISTTTNFTDHGPNYNPFNPPAPISPMQVTTQAGRTQCTAACYVNYPATAAYTLFGVANAPTVHTLNVLTGSISTSPLINTTSTLNLTAFIEGYWNGSNAMVPALANQSIAANPNDCDMITVELHEAISPYNLVASTQAMLHQNGTATCTFPFVNGNYYIVVKHRNALETWSANPVTFSSILTSYNFSNAANKAYGNNMKEVSPDVWAMYSGDSYKDLNIDLLDKDQVENDVLLFSYGNFDTDINGDGNVDLLDFDLVRMNNNNFIYSMRP